MKKILITIIFIYLTSLVISNSAVAILSATTTNVIYGHPPELKKIIDKEAFKLNLYLDEKHSIELTPHTDKKYYIGANIKFSQIKTAFDATYLKDYFINPDGDEIESVQIISESLLWKKNGSDISNTGNLIINSEACDSTTNYKYTLTVTLNVKVKKTYGLPNESEIITLNHTYDIDANTGVCYLRPYDMAINSLGGGTGVVVDHTHDKDFFTPTKSLNSYLDNLNHTGGFKYNVGFPTTAFKNARFRIILSDGKHKPTDYSFDILDSPSEISVKDNNQVIFNSKPKNNTYYVKITKSENNFITFYPIKLESKNSWFTGYGSFLLSFNNWTETNNPIVYCKSLNQRSPRLRDLGNSKYVLPPSYIPNNDIANGWNNYGNNNGYYRTISSASKIEEGKAGLSAEWGRIYYYDANAFKFSWYWTSDYRDDGPNAEKIRFAYGMVQGNINYGNRASNNSFYGVCVEDL